MRRFVKEEASHERVVKLKIFISHPFGILPSLSPNVFLLGNLQVNYLSMI
jgi:hypothetical protein